MNEKCSYVFCSVYRTEKYSYVSCSSVFFTVYRTEKFISEFFSIYSTLKKSFVFFSVYSTEKFISEFFIIYRTLKKRVLCSLVSTGLNNSFENSSASTGL